MNSATRSGAISWLLSADDQGFNGAAPYASAAITGAHAPCLAAGEVAGANRRQRAAAATAERLLGQQMAGPAMFPKPGRPRLLHSLTLANAAQTLLHGVPQGLSDDA